MKLKNFPMIFCSALTLSLVLALSLPYSSYSKHNPPPELQDQDGGHRHDPCERALRGKAFERDRRCPPVGSSSGIARGDFNGDGAPDLAVGIPGKDLISGFPTLGKVQNAGAVAIIYGLLDHFGHPLFLT